MADQRVEYDINIVGNIEKKLDGIILEQNKINSNFDKTKAKAIASGNDIGTSFDKTKAKAISLGSEGSNSIDKLNKNFNSLRFGAMAAAGAILGIGYGISSVTQAAAAVESQEKSMRTASGSITEYLRNIAFTNDMNRRFGVNLETTRQGLTQFAASTKNTALQGQKTRDIFKAVTVASSVMGLSVERQNLVFSALSQIAGKGVLSMEELRQQLGDSLPGAVNIAARAMGKTTAEFTKMVSEGKVLSSEFLPKFAEELSKTFSAGVDTESLNTNITKIQSAFKTLSENVGYYFKDVVDSFADYLNEKANKMKGETAIQKTKDVLVDYRISKEILNTRGNEQIIKDDIDRRYEEKYGFKLSDQKNAKELEKRIYQQEVLPRYAESIEAQKAVVSEKLASYMESVHKTAGKGAKLTFWQTETVTLGEYREELVKLNNDQYLYNQLLKEYGVNIEKPEPITTDTNSKTTGTTEKDVFGGTTITAKSPLTFNISINELIGIKELNNNNNQNELGTKTGNLVLDELIKAVSQVQMMQAR